MMGMVGLTSVEIIMVYGRVMKSQILQFLGRQFLVFWAYLIDKGKNGYCLEIVIEHQILQFPDRVFVINILDDGYAWVALLWKFGDASDSYSIELLFLIFWMIGMLGLTTVESLMVFGEVVENQILQLLRRNFVSGFLMILLVHSSIILFWMTKKKGKAMEIKRLS